MPTEEGWRAWLICNINGAIQVFEKSSYPSCFSLESYYHTIVALWLKIVLQHGLTWFNKLFQMTLQGTDLGLCPRPMLHKTRFSITDRMTSKVILGKNNVHLKFQWVIPHSIERIIFPSSVTNARQYPYFTYFPIECIIWHFFFSFSFPMKVDIFHLKLTVCKN